MNLTGTAERNLGNLATAACSLYIFGYPLLEMARARVRTIGPLSNAFIHVRRLSDPSSRLVTTPNNDTLYSSAWIDLSRGPVDIILPDTGGRYVSLALLDLYTNNFIVTGLGDGPGAKHVRIAPPGAAVVRDAVVAPTWWVWGQVRTLVAGAGDLASARALQNGIELHARGGGGAPAPAPPEADPYSELLAIDAMIRGEAPAPPEAAPLLAEVAEAGLTSQRLQRDDPEVRHAAAQGVASAQAVILAHLANDIVRDGWIYQAPHLGNFGTDYVYRASIAQWGLGALPMREAMYMRAVAADLSRTFDGRRVHVLRFPAGQTPPVDGFWSLSLYEVDTDGRLYFTANALGRYAIGDRTPGLVASEDGDLEIWMSAAPPPSGRPTNWLPTPAGPFALVMRSYLPRLVLRDGRYRLPPVTEVDPRTGVLVP